MKNPHAPTDPDKYETWINEAIGAAVRRRRMAMGLTPYALALALVGSGSKVSDQTILNIEQAKPERRGTITGTLARLAMRLSTTLSDLIDEAEREGPG